MDGTIINGCNTGSYSRMAKKCRSCNNREYCNNKRLEAEAYIIPSKANNGTMINAQAVKIPDITISAEEATDALIKAMQSVGCGSSYRNTRT